jgi:hypothetical protein
VSTGAAAPYGAIEVQEESRPRKPRAAATRKRSG